MPGVPAFRALLVVLAASVAVSSCRSNSESVPPPTPEQNRLVPSGDISIAPPRFTFPEVPGAARYRITLRDAKGSEVARVEGTASPLIFPQTTSRSLIRGESYRWDILYLDPLGAPTGVGPQTTFVIR